MFHFCFFFILNSLYIIILYEREMAFSEASTLSKVGLGISILAVLFDIAAFPTPYWMMKTLEVTGALTDTNVGLFQSCSWGKICTAFSTSECKYLYGTGKSLFSILGKIVFYSFLFHVLAQPARMNLCHDILSVRLTFNF